MKHAPAGFLFILGIQYMIHNSFSFPLILKLQRLVYSVFPSIFSSQLLLALSQVLFICSTNSYFIQYHSNIIPFTYNSNIVGCFINRNKNKLFLECFKTTYDVNLFQNRIEFSWFNSSFKLSNFSSIFFKMVDFQGINDS